MNATHIASERSSAPSHVLQDLRNIQDTDFFSSKYNLAQRKRSFDVKPIALFEGRMQIKSLGQNVFSFYLSEAISEKLFFSKVRHFKILYCGIFLCHTA